GRGDSVYESIRRLLFLWRNPGPVLFILLLLILILLCWLAARPFMPTRIFSLIAAFLLAAVVLRAEQLLPTAPGTSWQYDSKEEFGGPAAERPVESIVTIWVGTQLFEKKDLVKFGMYSGDTVICTELVSFSD